MLKFRFQPPNRILLHSTYCLISFIRFCDSPTSDLESRNKTTGRPKRGRNNNSSGDLSNYTETRSSIHSKLRNSTKGRRGSNASNGTRTPPCTMEKNVGKRKTKEAEVEEPVSTSKRQKTGARPNSSASDGRHTPVLIECPQPNCNKKYKHKNGLHYHLSHAHHNNLDKDGNWRETIDDGDDDSKSSASDDVCVPSEQTKDKKKDAKDTKESSKEEERMEVDKSAGSIKSVESSEEGSTGSMPQAGSPEGSVDSNGDGAGGKKGDSAKNREVTKSPKAHKIHVDKFTAGMKCLGIPKPKEGKCSPSKAPKNDANVDKAGKSAKKQLPMTSDKDLSIFDFNSTSELDEQGAVEASSGGNLNDKHVNVSVIRPNPETSSVKTEPVSPSSFAKVSDNARGPKQSSSNIVNADQGTEDKNAKKVDKDKQKSDKHKKTKHDKMLMKTGKTIRPIAPAPPPGHAPAPTTAPAPTVPASAPTPTSLPLPASAAHAPPPQLIAIPTSLVQNSVAVTCSLSVPGINTVVPKPQVTTVNPALKPIQPKPPVTTPVPSQDDAGSPSMLKDKDKKNKPKKKVKGDKEREKEKEKLPGSPIDSSKLIKEQPCEQRPKNLLLPAVPETNILKQALTASGIVEPDSGDKNKILSSDLWKRDGNKPDANVERVPKVLSSSKDKPASTAPVSSIAMPQIPKLIPTSSVTVQSSRPSKQLTLPLQHPPHPLPGQHQQPPSQLQQTHQQQPPMSMAAGVKMPVSKSDVGQERTSSNLSVHTSFNKDSPKSSQLLSPPGGNRTGNISPAYSDISEDGVDDQSKQAKTLEAFPFDSATHAKQQSDSVRRGNSGNLAVERMPMFQGPERKGIQVGAPGGEGVVQAKPHERDSDRKVEGKDQGSQRHASINQALPPSMPHMFSGSHYPYFHGFVNVDPAFRQQHERLVEEQRKRAEKLRAQEGLDKRGDSKSDSAEKRRPPVNLQTEPITPPHPQAPRHLEGRDKHREKEHITKSRHLDFLKKEPSLPNTVRTTESEKQISVSIAERHKEELRKLRLYQQQVADQQRQAEHHRQSQAHRKVTEQESQQKDINELPKKDLMKAENVSKSRTPTPTPRNVSTPTKEPSGRQSADADKRDAKSPLSKGSKPDGKPEQRKLLEGYPYLQPPYPYGSIPYDPSHPHFQPMVYPAFLHPDLHYPPTSSAVGSAWKPSSEKPGFEPEPERGSSPHSLSSKGGGKSPDSHDPPQRPLDVLQQHTNQYFSPPQKHGSTSRPRTPEKGRTTPGQHSRSSSPAARKTPEMSSTSASVTTSNREEGRGSRPTVHQHMHTHQHTHVGMGYPVLPSYDPYGE